MKEDYESSESDDDELAEIGSDDESSASASDSDEEADAQLAEMGSSDDESEEESEDDAQLAEMSDDDEDEMADMDENDQAQLAEMTADEEDQAVSQLDTEEANKWFRMRYGNNYWRNKNWKKRYSASYVYRMGKLMRNAKWASRAGTAAVDDVQKGLVMLSNRLNLVKRSIAKLSNVKSKSHVLNHRFM